MSPPPYFMYHPHAAMPFAGYAAPPDYRAGAASGAGVGAGVDSMLAAFQQPMFFGMQQWPQMAAMGPLMAPPVGAGAMAGAAGAATSAAALPAADTHAHTHAHTQPHTQPHTHTAEPAPAVSPPTASSTDVNK